MHSSCFFFRHVDLERSIDCLELHGYRRENIEICLLQFSNGTNHKSANKAAVQLDPFGWYDKGFKTHIEIMGGYLVVLLAQYRFASHDRVVPTGRYQTRYFVNWVKGHVIQVRALPTTVESFFEFPMSPAANEDY